MSTEPYFYSYMKIRDVGEYYQDFFQDFSMETFREIIDKFELRPELRAKQLSSGMMAKLKVAVTMARSADVILLDEPLNGIDLIARDQVMELIISHASKDSTLLLSSHLVEEMVALHFKGYFVKDGDMVASLDVEDLRIKEGLSLAEKYRQLLCLTLSLVAQRGRKGIPYAETHEIRVEEKHLRQTLIANPHRRRRSGLFGQSLLRQHLSE